MWRSFGHFALLIWLPGALDALKRTCSAPSLNNGYFLPAKKPYSHKTRITYACKSGHKPTAEGWWAASACEDGRWLPKPQCIEETACIPPTISNGEYTQSSDGWYKDGSVIRIVCNSGYTHKDNDATAQCLNGTWSSVPACEKDGDACSVPPEVPNAVVKNQYQEVFAAGSQVEYHCKTGHRTEDGQASKSIYCLNGDWDQGPTCSSSTSSTVNEEDTAPFLPIDKCGEFPVVENGVSQQHDQRSLKYQCGRFYKLDGPEIVVCSSNGHWSTLPTCKVNHCSVDTEDYPGLIDVGVVYLVNGGKMELGCKDNWSFTNYALFQCRDVKPTISECCNRAQIGLGLCRDRR